MRIRSLLITKKFVITFVIGIVLLFLIGFSFAPSINASFDSLLTWNNCEGSYVAYDLREFDENCYYYYGKKISVNLSTGDSIRLNTDVYQFIKGKTYDYRSIINDRNIAVGQYSSLSGNEIAIPIGLAEKYNLQIGDSIYLFGRDPYKIKYIFRNVYDIKNPSIYSNGNAVFIGGDTPVGSDCVYCVFDTGSAVYNEVYTFSRAKSEFYKTGFGFIGLIFALSILVQVGIFALFRKAEVQNLYNDCISGSRCNYRESLIGVNILLHIVPAVLTFAVLAALGDIISAITVICSAIGFTIVKMVCFRIQIH